MTLLEPDFERTLRRYVLDTLDDAARLEIEGRLIQDPDAFEALGVVEDELMEEYLDDALSNGDRRRFERHACRPEHRRGVPGFFEALRDRAATPATEPEHVHRWSPADWFRPAALQPAWLAAAAAALLISLGANLWLAQRQTGLEAQMARLEAEARQDVQTAAPAAPSPRLAELETANQDLEARLEAERALRLQAETRVAEVERAAQRPATSTPTFVLAAGLLRGAGSLARVVVPPDADVVRLLLDLPSDDYPLYRAVLSDVDGEEIWAQSRLKTEQRQDQILVPVLAPAPLLPRGDYQLELSGITEDGEPEGLARYTFRVVPD